MKKEYLELWNKYNGHGSYTVLGRYSEIDSESRAVEFSNSAILAAKELLGEEDTRILSQCFLAAADTFIDGNSKNICITEWTLAKLHEFKSVGAIDFYDVAEEYLALARQSMLKHNLCNDFKSVDNLFFDDLREKSVANNSFYARI